MVYEGKDSSGFWLEEGIELLQQYTTMEHIGSYKYECLVITQLFIVGNDISCDYSMDLLWWTVYIDIKQSSINISGCIMVRTDKLKIEENVWIKDNHEDG